MPSIMVVMQLTTEVFKGLSFIIRGAAKGLTHWARAPSVSLEDVRWLQSTEVIHDLRGPQTPANPFKTVIAQSKKRDATTKKV